MEQNLPTQPAVEPEDTEQALEELEQKFAVLRKTREAVVFFCSFQWRFPARHGGTPIEMDGLFPWKSQKKRRMTGGFLF